MGKINFEYEHTGIILHLLQHFALDKVHLFKTIRREGVNKAHIFFRIKTQQSSFR